MILFKLIGLVVPLMGYMIIAITLGVLGYLMAIGIPVIGTYGLLNHLSFIHLSFILILFALLRGVLRYGEQACNHFIAFKLLAHIRDLVFGVLRKLAPAKLENKQKGNLISLLTSDIELLEVFYAHTISPIFIALFVSLIMVLLIGSKHVLLGLFTAFAYIFIGVLIPIYFGHKSENIGIKHREKAGQLNSYVLESMRGLEETLQYEDTSNRLKGLNKRTDELGTIEKELKSLQGTQTSFTNLSISLLTVLFLIISSHYVASKENIILSVVMFMSSFGPVIALSNLGTGLSQTLGAASRVIALLEEEPLVKEIEEGKTPVLENVDIKNIDFKYEQEKILENYSLHLPDHQLIGIHGKSGSGKSTLLKLLMRFFEVDQGIISFNNNNINTIKTSHLRNNESYVTQETVLFHDTIKNNIKIAKLDATDEEVIQACKKASIHDFIISLKDGYDTQVGELGSTLSGGERQRIGLARSFLHDSPVVFYDEPTSNLDSLNEGMILKAIYEEKKEKTIVMVSHRESTLKRCDTCIEMKTERDT